ncbi:SusC/RagA family TonB-linked outer membrane protein [Catalinimonas alkaloidigena]|nr:TonB-dependent receptor [Catalinimonas alkaloidigena]
MVLLLLTGNLLAQSRTVSGKVVSAQDQTPLPGVNVSEKGTTNGTVTDVNGRYSLTVSGDATLVFSFIGFTAQEVALNNRSVVDVTLAEDVQALNEVVVVGYGTQEKADLTGNIAQVSGEEIQNLPVTSVEQAIQGRATGVFIESNNGKLGQGISIRVRGSSSVTASNQPLYVIDGIPITAQSQSGNGAPTNPLADINFNDIESINILKDASAAAIYGSRASNGVVLITTKQGKSGKTKFSVNLLSGVSNPTGKREYLNAQQYVELFTEAAANSNALDPSFDYVAYLESRFDRYAAGTDWRQALNSTPAVDENWQEQAFQKGGITQLDLNASGGNEKTRFYVAGSYSDQKGIMIRNSFERINGRINLDHQATERLNLGLNLSLSRTVNDRLSDDNSFATPLQLVAQPPIQPVIDPRTNALSGNYTLYFNGLLYVDNAKYTTTVFRNLGNLYASYNILPGLKFRTEFGVDILNQNEEEYYGKLTARNVGTSNGLGANRYVQLLNYTTNNFFQYNQTIGTQHNIEATVGMSFQESRRDMSYVEGQQFPSDAFKQLASAAEITSGTTEETAFSFLSYFARANYAYANRYLLTLSGRIDGSSRFGANERYGFFPAASMGWVLTEESFLNTSAFLSFLKLRASYGLTGNAEISNFAARGLFSGDGAYGGVPGLRPSQSPNPNLKWETTAQTDIGIDYGFLRNRISGEIDYYVKQTRDLLLNVNVPGSSGFTTQMRNIGKLQNKGFEFMVNTSNLVGDFTWNTSLNFSINRNKITDLDGQVIEGGFVNRAIEGYPIGVFYEREYAGVDPENGDALYYINDPEQPGSRETTNDYNAANRIVIGNPNPDWIGGINNTFGYKGLELTVFFQGVFGNEIYNGGGKFFQASADFFDNQTTDQLRRWQQPGDITDVPQARLFFGNGTGESSRFLSDGSYVRLKTVTLGYTLPSAVISKLKLDRVRIYVTGQNLLTFTKYEGWDPEVNADYLTTSSTGNISLGNDFYSAPQPRTITAGINLGF